jgi:hypothetical protein
MSLLPLTDVYISPDGSRADHRTVALADEGQEKGAYHDALSFTLSSAIAWTCSSTKRPWRRLVSPPATRRPQDPPPCGRKSRELPHIRPGPSRRVDNVRKETKSLHSRKKYYVASSTLTSDVVFGTIRTVHSSSFLCSQHTALSIKYN